MISRKFFIYSLSAFVLAAILFVALTFYWQRELPLSEIVPQFAAAIEGASEKKSTVRFLTSDPDAVDAWASFSPDGKLVLFSRSVGFGNMSELYIIQKKVTH